MTRKAPISGGVRRAAAVVVLLCALALGAPGVGEPDRPESTALGVIRAIQSGELAYAAINGGYYDTLECVAGPSCVPGVRSARAFVDPDLAAARERRGYRFEFHAGPAPAPGSDERRSRSAVTRFAVVAIPLAAQAAEHRAFCGDDTGAIYFTRVGTVPRVEGGRCLDTAGRIR